MARAFVIRPFNKKKDASGKEIDFEKIHNELITPALKAAKLEGETTGEIVDSGNIREDIFALILEADLVICDITIHNANVFYELGIRHALRKKSTILIKGKSSENDTPFDLLTDRYFSYEILNPASNIDNLTKTCLASLKSNRPTDSPIFQMLPSLVEADPSKVQVVPFDFTEEVDRAQAAQSQGWLRLLSDEVKKCRFHWEGLKLVAKAQWDLKDWEGAKESLEEIRKIYPQEVEANLALANIYERLYRKENRYELLENSDQAINRVLSSNKVMRKQIAEALALQARNEKTRWRLEFSHLKTTEERCKAAMNRACLNSFKRYREAFLQDLNHFYSGLAALQMGTILLNFIKEDFWHDAFDSDDEAEAYKREIQNEVKSLSSIVPMSIKAALCSLEKDESELVWAKISEADMLYLTDEREDRVVNAYINAIPVEKPFTWDATKGQLKLFCDLNIKEQRAEKIIEKIDNRFKEHEAKNVNKKDKPDKPIHLLVFAGHCIDLPGRTEPRFPPEKEGRARELINDVLKDLIDIEHEYELLASAAPGADIIAHEVFSDLGLKSTVCLPMPTESFAKIAFNNLDVWRNRFLDLIHGKQVLELSDKEGLPRWLTGSEINPWERGNRWVLNIALTWGAELVTLITLWDGKNFGDAPGGTAHMIKLCQESGRIRIRHIKTEELIN